MGGRTSEERNVDRLLGLLFRKPVRGAFALQRKIVSLIDNVLEENWWRSFCVKVALWESKCMGVAMCVSMGLAMWQLYLVGFAV